MTMQKRTDEKGATRREFMSLLGAGAASCAIGPALAEDTRQAIVVDPQPRFELSPYLYMQFMEPLGTTDGSAAAAWDAGRDCWREDDVTGCKYFLRRSNRERHEDAGQSRGRVADEGVA